MDPALEPLHWRFATKEFSEAIVPEEEITYLMEAARLAPGSANTQPWHVIVVQDRKLLDELVPVCNNQLQVKTTNCMFIFCANKDLNDAIDKVVVSLHEAGRPEEEIATWEAARRKQAAKPPEEQLRFAQNQLYMAAGFLIYAAALHHVDAGPMAGLDPDGVARVLNLPENLRPTINVAVGYRKEPPKRPKIRNATDVMFERR